MLGGGPVQGVTEPSKLAWTTASKDGRFSIEVASVAYLAKYDDASGKILLRKDLASPAEDGELSTFRVTEKEAINESHCSTVGLRFKLTIGGKEETGSKIAPIY